MRRSPQNSTAGTVTLIATVAKDKPRISTAQLNEAGFAQPRESYSEVSVVPCPTVGGRAGRMAGVVPEEHCGITQFTPCDDQRDDDFLEASFRGMSLIDWTGWKQCGRY
jgi:hypothetical protein